MLLKKANSAAAGVTAHDESANSEHWKRYPATFEFLAFTKWSDGSHRKVGTLNIFVEAGRWKCFVNDKAQDRSACVSAPSWEALMDSIEMGLVTDDLDWRPSFSRGRGK